MTLWRLIRDFFVENLFGGYLSSGRYISNSLGYGLSTNGYVELNTSNSFVDVGLTKNDGTIIKGITFGDWLSTTFTIITLILLVIFLYIFVKWIFKLFSGLLR